MAFGDVNLSEEQIQKGNPGAGGWPTIRYFNKDTGYEGRNYEKKTDGAMCDELGDENNMQAYVEEAGGVLMCTTLECLCGRREGGECEKKEVDYYNKFKGMSRAEIGDRLSLLSCAHERPLSTCTALLPCPRPSCGWVTHLSHAWHRRSLAKSAKKDEWMSQRVAILKLLDSVAAEADTKQEL